MDYLSAFVFIMEFRNVKISVATGYYSHQQNSQGSLDRRVLSSRKILRLANGNKHFEEI
jgi:hypothetical protein